MSIIDALKSLVGYSGNDYDHIFALVSMLSLIHI